MAVKTWLIKHIVLTEFCRDCGIRQPLVWYADNDLWEEVSFSKAILCPKCFTYRAKQLDIMLVWKPNSVEIPLGLRRTF